MNSKRLISGTLFASVVLCVILVIADTSTKALARSTLEYEAVSSNPSIEHLSSNEVWQYWQYEDLKALDPWGDSASDDRDIIAVYEKEEEDAIYFRVDVLNLQGDALPRIYFALDFKSGGNTQLEPGNDLLSSDIEWDLLVSVSDSGWTLYDTSYTELPGDITYSEIDSQLDFVAFAVSKAAFAGWDGSAFQMQAIMTDIEGNDVLDRSTPASTDNTTGRVKLVLDFQNHSKGQGPARVDWYDGFNLRGDERPGERRGLKYLLDAIEKYRLPLTIFDLQIQLLPGNEYLRINERIRRLSEEGLLDPLTTLSWGYFMAWQPDDVDAQAIEIARELREGLQLPVSDLFYPYEAMITAGDIEVIKDAGFRAIYGFDQYGYWFGWMDDWSDIGAVRKYLESLGKIHVINGMEFVFETGDFLNFAYPYLDSRWEEDFWEGWNEYEMYVGTDNGLDLAWRRVLLDLALDPDQERYFTIGTDLNLTAWLFQDEAEWNVLWLASHPWIEATTFSDILDRNWDVIDHGDLGLALDELLIRFPKEGDEHYNAYFPQFYYGGISDGHSPLIPEGVEIEAYFDYVPFLRDGEHIPSGRKMGDDRTPGTIVYETLQNLRASPGNDLTLLAWLSYFMSIADQTSHVRTFYEECQADLLPMDDRGGEYLDPSARLRANSLRQVNKIVPAANWAEEAANGALGENTQVSKQDLDLDGEDEYVISNNKVFAIFENDGGRMEYAFSYSPETGALQLVAPISQHFKARCEWGWSYRDGEVAIRPRSSWAPDAAFIDDYSYAPYDVTLHDSSLTFVSEDNKITKTFTLEGDTVHANYVLSDLRETEIGFGLAVNMLNMFEMDWSENIEVADSPGSVGWRTTSGGFAAVNLEDTYLNSRDSFTDSPARDEMREREDSDSYPHGHWLFYPYNCITVDGERDFSISLTLGQAYPDNPSFEDDGPVPAPWSGKKLTSKDKRVCNRAHDGSCSFLMTGTKAKKSLRQVVRTSGSAGDSFTLSGWSKAKNPSPTGGAYCLLAKVFHTDGTKKKYKICFTKSTHGWQFREKAFTAAKDYNKIVVSLTYKDQTGKAWFDDVRLFAQ